MSEDATTKAPVAANQAGGMDYVMYGVYALLSTFWILINSVALIPLGLLIALGIMKMKGGFTKPAIIAAVIGAAIGSNYLPIYFGFYLNISM